VGTLVQLDKGCFGLSYQMLPSIVILGGEMTTHTCEAVDVRKEYFDFFPIQASNGQRYPVRAGMRNRTNFFPARFREDI